MLVPSFPFSVTDNLRPFLSTSSFDFFVTFFAVSATSIFVPIKSAVMSSTKTLNFQRRVNLCNFSRRILHHITQKQATPLGPWQDGRDGPERLRHTSFELHTPRMLIKTAQHSRDLCWETEVRSPGPHHRKTDPLEGLRQIQDQGYYSLVFFSCSAFEPLHLHQDLADCALSSSMSPVNSVPNPHDTSAATLPLLVLSRHQRKGVSHS